MKFFRQSGFFLGDPEVRTHADYRSVIFKQMYRQKLNHLKIQNWSVVGGDVRWHSLGNHLKPYLQKNIYALASDIKWDQLVPVDELILNIKKSRIEYRLALNKKNRLVPVYYIYERAPLVATAILYVIDAQSGQQVGQQSLHHRFESGPTPIYVFNAKDKIQNGVIANNDVSFDASKKCQVLSADGVPDKIYPQNCQLVYDGRTFLAGSDESARRAQRNSDVTLKFYRDVLNQNGLDSGKNMQKLAIISVVHVGVDLDNAYWDDDMKVIMYGDGNINEKTWDYTRALDISAHEFTHGIISQTAGLKMEGESGALNEGFADIFGILVSRANDTTEDWAIGRNLFIKPKRGNSDVTLRSLAKPDIHQYSKRLCANMTCTEDNDYCEVHANSTIWSHAAYLIDIYFQSILKLNPREADAKLAKLYFLTLTHRLHENETLRGAAAQLSQTCREIYDAPTCQIVTQSLRDVELL